MECAEGGQSELRGNIFEIYLKLYLTGGEQGLPNYPGRLIATANRYNAGDIAFLLSGT